MAEEKAEEMNAATLLRGIYRPPTSTGEGEATGGGGSWGSLGLCPQCLMRAPSPGPSVVSELVA